MALVTYSLYCISPLLRLGKCWEHDGGQDPDNGDDNQKLDQCEPGDVFSDFHVMDTSKASVYFLQNLFVTIYVRKPGFNSMYWK